MQRRSVQQLGRHAGGRHPQRLTTTISGPVAARPNSAVAARTPVAGPVRAAHSRSIFIVVAIALAMSSLDSTIVSTALPTIEDDLATSVTWAGWTLTVYSLGMVLVLPMSGTLTRRIGARRMFLFSIVVFGAASACCGFADGITMLIVFRFIQALGGAGFTPSATQIIVDHFGPARDKAIGLFGAIFTGGAMVGPLVGGLIVTFLSWRAVFWVNVPVAAVLTPLCLRWVPSDRPAVDRPRAPFDIPGAILIAVGLLATMVGLTVAGDTPQGWLWWAGGIFSVAIIAGVWFVAHIRRSAHPVITPRLIYGRGFAAVNTINLLYGGAGIGMVALIPLYATTRYHIDTLGSGTLLTAESVGAVVFSTMAALMLRRTGYRRPLYQSAVLAAIGMVGVALPPPGVSPYLWLAACAAVVGVGLGMASPASRNAGLQLVPQEAATIAALRTIGMQTGSIAAISLATSVIAMAPRGGLTQAVMYAGFAVVLAAAGPLITAHIPEHRGSW